MNQWRKEYLESLRESSKASKGSVDNMIDIGDVVVLKDDKSTRVLWKLAKVEELIWDKSGQRDQSSEGSCCQQR